MENFSFLVPNQVAGMGYPWPEDITQLVSMGFKSLLSLSSRIPNSPDLKKLNHRHIALPDCTRIPANTLNEIVMFMKKASKPLAVHCDEGGKSRTGVALACWLLSSGYNPEQALEKVRNARPGSIENEDMELSVWDYYQFLQNFSLEHF